jgi:N-dimethylarginine dimethylaminohydrolase
MTAEPTQPAGRPESEFAVAPQIVLVHDPVDAGGLDAIESHSHDGDLERELLFRERPDTEIYGRQHKAFVAEIRRHVPEVYYLADLIGGNGAYAASMRNPNLVFTRDSVITIPWVPYGYVGARMKPPLRRGETRATQAALEHLGLREIARVPDDLFLEGGDVVPFVREGLRALLVGFGPRTTLDTLDWLQETFIPTYIDEIIGVELGDCRLNLDGGLLPVAEDVIIADIGSIVRAVHIDRSGSRGFDIWDMFRSLGMRIIETTRHESVFSQACNCLCLGNRQVVYYDLCDRVRDLLQEHDVRSHLVAGSELIKGRGGPRCMSRPIYQATTSRV